MTTLNDIDLDSEDGKMLMVALSILTVSPEIHISGEVINGQKVGPDEMLQMMAKVKDEIYANAM